MFLILAVEDEWLIEENVALREDEILKNIPFTTRIGRNNSIIIEDDLGFTYRKGYAVKNAQHWTCSKRTRLKCRAVLKTEGNIILLQRFEHNHSIYGWNSKIKPILNHFSVCSIRLPTDAIACNRPYTLHPGKKGKGVFLKDEWGYEYHKDAKVKANGDTTWFCWQRRRLKCPVSVSVREDQIIWQRREHNHAWLD